MRSALAALLLLAAAPVAAQSPITPAQRAVPAQLDAAERDAFAQAFRDLTAGRTAAARAVAEAWPASVLAPPLQAQLTLAAKPRRADAATLADWVRQNPDAPQAPALSARARMLGATDLPVLPVTRTATASPRPAKLSDDDAVAARAAWDAFQSGDDATAIQTGLDGGATGAWTAGLAAWRSGDCGQAAKAFDAARSLGASANYWSSRAHLACGKPKEATARLRAAAAEPSGFYALLARRALGMATPENWAEPDFIQADWTTLSKLPGARRAAALVEIGQLGLADRELKYLAATADPTAYEPLMRLAARLNMPATQYQLAQRPPAGAAAPLAAKYPAPDWRPAKGWRVDKALVFAHALQESNFVTDATSRAGARGLMQLMPNTAKQVARMQGEICDETALTDPSFNIEYGQAYLEHLRDMGITGGLLPKVIAAYNAGPGSVKNWNASVRDNGDPLLFIESIPFKETRRYVQVVLKNYWMYQSRLGAGAPSLDAVAQNLWPRFPGLPGATAIRLTPAAVQTAAVAAVAGGD